MIINKIAFLVMLVAHVMEPEVKSFTVDSVIRGHQEVGSSAMGEGLP